MTSTSVADVSAYIANFTSAKVTGSGMDAAGSFNNVLKQQTDSRIQTAKESTARPQTGKAVHERMNSKESVVKTEKGSSLEDKTEKSEEEIAGMVEDVIAQMLAQTAQELNMTVEEVTALLEELQLNTTDLLNPDTIPVLVLKAYETTDMMELVTNQELYETVQTLTEELRGMEANLMQEAGITEEELSQVLQSMETAVQTEGQEQGMAVTVSSEKTLTVSQTDSKENSEAVTGKELTETEAAPEITVIRKSTAKGKEADAQNPGQGHTPFAQNLDLANEISRMVPTTGEVFTTGSSGHIMNQVMDYLNTALQPDMTELEMQLHPESLGRVNVHLSAKEGVVTAQFTAQNETVKAVLESQMIQLKESFVQQGIKVEAVEVTVEYHGFERSMDQNTQSDSGAQEGRKSRPRRLRIDELQDVEENELSEEEQLALRMMEQNGNTVDYTA